MKRKLWKAEVVAAAVLGVLLFYILMLKPIVGVADNGDFYRVMRPTGLSYLTSEYKEMYFGYIHRLYDVQSTILWGGGGFVTTQIIPVKLAIGLNVLMNRSGFFDIRFLSFIYSVVFIVSMYLVIKYNKTKSVWVNALLVVLGVLIFADVGYISYFNSLYGEAASYAFLFLALGLFFYLLKMKEPSRWILAAFFIASVFFIGSKQQNSPIGIIMALLFLRLWGIKKTKPWRKGVVLCSAFLVFLSTLSYLTITEDIRWINQYQTVFLGIVKDSATPVKDLEELGISPELAVLAGTTYYDAPVDHKSDRMQKLFYDKINYKNVLLFYLKHPSRFLEKMEICAQQGFSIRQGYLGNYEKAEDVVYGKKTNAFSYWSSFKKEVLPNALWFVALFYLVFFSVLLLKYRKLGALKDKIRLEMMAFIGLMGLIQFVVPMIGDGEGDLSKHLFLFNVSFDMMFLVSALWIVQKSASVQKLWKARQTKSL